MSYGVQQVNFKFWYKKEIAFNMETCSNIEVKKKNYSTYCKRNEINCLTK